MLHFQWLLLSNQVFNRALLCLELDVGSHRWDQSLSVIANMIYAEFMCFGG